MSKTIYICQLPQIEQQKIKNKLTSSLKKNGITDIETELNMALNSRICDVEELL